IGAQQIGGPGADFANTISTDAANNIYTAGTFENTVDFDPGAGIYNLASAGTDDIFISKLDVSGNFLWAKQIGGIGYDEITSIALDSSGTIYTTGDFEDSVDFDPGTGTSYLVANPNEDIFVSELDASGNFLWAAQAAGSLYAYSYGIATDNYGSVYVTGGFQGTVDFDPGPGITNFTSAGNYDIFTMKLGSGVFTGTSENNFLNSIRAFPNPSSGQLNLSFDHSLDHATLLLLNTTGQTIMEKRNISGSQYVLDLSEFANGIYFIKMLSDDKIISTEKIIKQ
ncbi:MAG TPA: SBBP repeat-containing protein, partial [Bacteroidia bacterium]|nr:SBBP repeat-containing protein [Bacteroidia bacterium]